MKQRHCHWHRDHSHHGSPLFGIFLLIIGGILVLNSFFGYDIPTVRTILALLFIYLGLSTLCGAWVYRSWSHKNYRIFRESSTEAYYIRKDKAHIRITNEKLHGPHPKLWFETRTGETTIDMTPLDLQLLAQTERPAEIYSKTRTGRTLFIIPAALPIEVHAITSWGDTQLPDGTHNTYGAVTYQSHQDKKPLLVIYTEVRMGNVDFIVA